MWEECALFVQASSIKTACLMKKIAIFKILFLVCNSIESYIVYVYVDLILLECVGLITNFLSIQGQVNI